MFALRSNDQSNYIGYTVNLNNKKESLCSFTVYRSISSTTTKTHEKSQCFYMFYMLSCSALFMLLYLSWTFCYCFVLFCHTAIFNEFCSSSCVAFGINSLIVRCNLSGKHDSCLIPLIFSILRCLYLLQFARNRYAPDTKYSIFCFYFVLLLPFLCSTFFLDARASNTHATLITTYSHGGLFNACTTTETITSCQCSP